MDYKVFTLIINFRKHKMEDVMARGRKREKDSKREVISIRITEEQKEVINRNIWIKKDIDKLVRDYINVFFQ